MRDKIKKEALEWYANTETHNNESIGNLVDLIMDKTTDFLFEEIKKELKNEFSSGTLKHDFVISPDYYLELKLKEVKQSFFKSEGLPPPEEL